MSENPDVTGDFAAFNTLTLKGTPITPGGGAIDYCEVQSLAQQVGDDFAVLVASLSTVVNTNPATFTPDTSGIAINVSGLYLVVAIVNFNAGDATGIRQLQLMQGATTAANGTQLARDNKAQIGNGENNTPSPSPLLVTWLAQFTAPTRCGIRLYQNSGNIMPTSGIFLQIAKLA